MNPLSFFMDHLNLVGQYYFADVHFILCNKSDIIDPRKKIIIVRITEIK